jgi:hypothetical protein
MVARFVVGLTLFYFWYQNVQLYCSYNQHLCPLILHPEILTKSAAAASLAP